MVLEGSRNNSANNWNDDVQTHKQGGPSMRSK
jgi:hypothetical protein